MNCENLQSDLPLYFDNVLSEDERVSIEKHLPTCPLCRQKLDEYKELTNTFRNISRPAIPNDLLSSVRIAVKNELNQPTIQIGNQDKTSFSEKLAHWILPYSVGTVAASILTFVMLTAILTGTDQTNSFVAEKQKNEESTILLAKATPTISKSEINPSKDFEQIQINDYQPEINPSGALMALSNSIVRGNMKDEEVVVVADVFNNGLAKISEVIEPPSDSESMTILQSAFDTDKDKAPFLPIRNNKNKDSMIVILKINRVEVTD